METQTEQAKSGKWSSEAGPRQNKKVEEALGAFRWRAKSFIQLIGTHGKPETESRSTLTPLVLGTPCEGSAEAMQVIRKRFNGAITRKNYQEIIEAVEAATEALALPVKDERRTQEEVSESAARIAERDAKCKAKDEKRKALWAQIKAKAPAKAKAVILATEEIDDCDIQTDYFNTKTGRVVAIGFRTGSREDFRQLRRAAATFPETEHLGPGCEVHEIQLLDASEGFERIVRQGRSGEKFPTEAEARAAIAEIGDEYEPYKWSVVTSGIEHRENYSMGKGNYLKGSGCNSSGWKVTSRPLEWGSAGVDEDAIPEKVEIPRKHTVPTGNSFKIVEQFHTKRGHIIQIVVLDERVGRERFIALRRSAKAAGGCTSHSASVFLSPKAS